MTIWSNLRGSMWASLEELPGVRQVLHCRGERALRPLRGRRAGNVVFEVQGNRTCEVRLANSASDPGPVHRALSHGTVVDRPPLGCLLPEKILERHHLQAWRDEMRGGLPRSAAAFRHRMPRIEVIAGPFRIQ